MCTRTVEDDREAGRAAGAGPSVLVARGTSSSKAGEAEEEALSRSRNQGGRAEGL